LLNGNLQTEQNKDFILKIKTEGKHKRWWFS
jgi:hypothetical protein